MSDDRPAARSHDRRRTALGLFTAIALFVSGCTSADSDRSPSASSQPQEQTAGSSPSKIEAAEEAYVAGLPLVTSMRTFQTSAGRFGINNLVWGGALAGPASRNIVAPNRDTLYSVAVLDLRSEPMVLTLPAVHDRYYTYQLLDAWTESFAYVGTRSADGDAGTWAITPPGWKGTLPAGTKELHATTPLVLMLGRFLVEDQADIANVTAIRDQSSLQPLSTYTHTEPPIPPPPIGAPAGTPQALPTDASFFDELAEALLINPPTTDEQRAIFDRLETLGIGPGLSPTAAQQNVLSEAAALGDAAIDDAIFDATEVQGGWAVLPNIGTYGDDIESRAAASRVVWGANVPEEAVYATARNDAGGEALDGANTYEISFPGDAPPPVEAFWSVTAYGPDMFFVANAADRYSVGDRTPDLVRSADGSITITVSHDEPAGQATNWLPVPEGRFTLMLRLYLPEPSVVEGRYRYPPINRL